MGAIDFLIGRALWLIVLAAVAVVVAQNIGAILSVLLVALLMLVIARLLWPSPRR
jgi:hypothetical protein